tara:strand:+ start:11054 stop:11293 length:240 start_codon:yes stop_codon:yes gene_type:complete
MNLYTTIIKAICPNDGILKTYGGPNVPGITFKDAEMYCEINGLGYCKVDGLLISEIPCKEGTFEPDWDNEIDYNKINLN